MLERNGRRVDVQIRRGRLSENDATIDGYNKNVNTSNPKSKLRTKKVERKKCYDFYGITQNEVKE